ncbi:MAG: hypothetical protein IJ335_05670 [Lachnospiraceae bacterium]|nr:hypothetical protein [Lachnospiraceae bacterium]
MVDWNDIKRAFEGNVKNEEQLRMEQEQRLLESIAQYLSAQKGTTSVKGYKPEEVAEFLQKSIPEVKQLLGGEWADISDDKLDTLIYTLIKKVRKSENILPWK